MKYRTMSSALFALFLYLLPGIGWAEVVWDSEALEFFPTLTDAEVRGEFRFTVTGDAPVSITSVRPDCGSCTIAKMEKNTYMPGESGSIGFIYSTIGEEGLQRKRIAVGMGDGVPGVVLRFSVTVPYLYQAKPRVLRWLVNSAPVEQVIVIDPGNPDFQIDDLLYDQTMFSVKRERQGDNTWLLRIVPLRTSAETKEKIQVVSNLVVGGRPKTSSLYLLITP